MVFIISMRGNSLCEFRKGGSGDFSRTYDEFPRPTHYEKISYISNYVFFSLSVAMPMQKFIHGLTRKGPYISPTLRLLIKLIIPR